MATARGLIGRRAFLSGAAASSLAPAFARAQDAKNADVVIIGAGLSGLFAAMQLQELGYRVLVLEAAQRIGGRLWTLDTFPGAPEAGGQQVGQTYARIRYAAEKTGVSIIDNPAQQRPQRLLAFKEALVDPSDWAASPHNPFPEKYRNAAPDSVLFSAAAAENPFDWPGAWRETGALAADISAADFLRQKGFSDDALALVNIALNANDLETYAMNNVWRSLQLFSIDRSIGPSGDVAGGAQRLPEAMARLLGHAVRTGTTVQSVSNNGNDVIIRTMHDTFTADFCIIAVPFPAVAKISIEPRLVGVQAAAVSSLPYTQILQLHLAPDTAFWELDGLPAAMWTDGPLERIFPVRERDTGEIVGLTAWINGAHARQLASSSDDSLEHLMQSEFSRMRPTSGGNLRLLKAVRWTRDASYSGGAYMHWAPGQAAKWANEMAAPYGRIHFAGEHLSNLHTGMEGAMESGERAALQIMEASN